MSFLAALLDGVSTKSVTDSRLHLARLGVLCLIHTDLRKLIQTFGLFHTVRGSNFDIAATYVAYCRVGEVEWSHSSLSTPF